jgi:RND family efflux transporter MFP subunit
LKPDCRIVLIAAVLAALNLACTRPQSQVQAKELSEAPLTIVPAAKVIRTSIQSNTVLTAEFQPFQEVDVMAKVAGYLRSIKVDLGDQVREGQLLAELEIPEMTDEVSRAAAMVDQGGAEIAAARDELQRAESSHEIAHISYERLLEVSKREAGLIPQQELDVVRSRDQIAEAQLASAKSRLRVEEQRTKVAKAEETRLRTMRNYVTIAAPFSGTVTRRYANIGAMIQAGIASQSQAMPLVRLSQLSVLRLSLPVPESLVPAVRIGQPVEVRVRSLGRTFAGRVARYAARLDTATRTMITEVDVLNPSRVMLPGMYAEVSLQSAKRDNVLAAPVEAIERAGAATRVFAIDESGELRIANVQLGMEDAHYAEILSGLAEGDLVVTGRRAGLNAGDRVKPKIVELEQ